MLARRRSRRLQFAGSFRILARLAGFEGMRGLRFAGEVIYCWRAARKWDARDER